MKSVRWSVLLAGVVATPAFSCDLCAVYSASQAQGEAGPGILSGLAGQFTHFGTTQFDGVEVPNPTGQHLDSTILQVFAGYNFSSRWGLQFNLPVIHRAFLRPEGFAIDQGSVSGIGDVSLTGHFNVVQHKDEAWGLSWSVLGGLKLPSGDTSRLAEELNEVEVPGAPESGIHGHDLTLGTGSVDGLVGTSLSARWQRLFFTATAQYSIRSTGAYDYRYANDVTWSGGPGAYVLLGDPWTLSLQLNISGEQKGLDTFQGATAGDTGTLAVYVGPELQMTWKNRLSFEVGADFPVVMNNTSFQTVPDYRIHGSLTFRF